MRRLALALAAALAIATASNAELLKSADGYMGAADFTEFLQSGLDSFKAVQSRNSTADTAAANANETAGEAPNESAESVAQHALKFPVTTILVLLVFGVLLNFTPCTLPLIPVQLAILGIGSTDRKTALGRGTAFGAGMAVAYGALGVAAVAAGTAFGTIQSSPWFNLAVAIVFFILALALFDVFHIDFKKYSPRMSRNAGIASAFIMGVVSATLAGACVAPALISTLLLASMLKAEGYAIAVLLPFVLGIGMALPWPLVAYGIARLPKPGRWMNVVRGFFAVAISLLAIHYLVTSYNLFARIHNAKYPVQRPAGVTDDAKPTLLIFTADWCRYCKMMESSTLKDESVVAMLDKFNVRVVDCDNQRDPEVRRLNQEFGIRGIPAFRIVDKVEQAPADGN